MTIAIVLVCCCGAPAVGGYMYLKTLREEPAVEATGEAYLTAVVNGDTGAAYDLLCDRERREHPASTWSPTSNDGNPPTGFRVTRVQYKDDFEASISAELTHEKVPSREVTIFLRKQDGDWKVCDGRPL